MLHALLLAVVVTSAVPELPHPVQATSSAQPPGAQTAPEKPWPPPGVVRPGADVTTPRLIRQIHPKYTAAARQEEIQGVVWLEAVIETNGTVGEVRVTKSLDKTHGLDDQAVEALKSWRFSPATRDGEAVPVVVAIEMSFTLRK